VIEKLPFPIRSNSLHTSIRLGPKQKYHNLQHVRHISLPRYIVKNRQSRKNHLILAKNIRPHQETQLVYDRRHPCVAVVTDALEAGADAGDSMAVGLSGEHIAVLVLEVGLAAT
jgi:hypothetical protein